MTELVRFGVSIERNLLTQFDDFIQKKGFPTRSKAINDLIRQALVKKEWMQAEEVAGTLTLVFDHHKRDLVNRVTDVQHHFHRLIISSQHIHLNHDHCLEVVIVRGKPEQVQQLADRLRGIKGMLLVSLEMAIMGSGDETD
ncbi:MAG: nickel-responsive transcriptional regulator NikR [Acidobacteria bacterium]|nr:MAG: nickel-responsive transcriptional regulator NikR [Acidobacteriota bacterium]PIE91406.1 MAG: nickel-responsive transcriptional regulator NikR [Acidobacteriota bacterium]